MKIAIMQPYFFPYLGYFDLIYNVDLFVIYDIVQYIKQGWINRNRILHPNRSGWQYISAPVNKASFHSSYQTPILDVEVSRSKSWEQHIIGQLAHYKKTAPRARETTDFVESCLTSKEVSISRLNVHILEQCAKLLKIDLEYRFCSNLDFEPDMEQDAEERILALCKFLGATEYVNLPGGVNLYHPEAFARRNIKLTFRELPTFTYNTMPYTFKPNLSIVDILMWNTPANIKKHLDQYQGKG